jgi:vacuolar-type H+-ATPase subunit E/Vma4
MEPVEQEKTALILDIEADARTEAEGIIKEAELLAAEKREYAAKQVESLLDQARLQAREQAQLIRNEATRKAQREARRRLMCQKATIVQEVMDRVERRLATMIDEPDYRSALVNWIAEAALGLGTGSAEVNASEPERALIDEQMLSEAGEKVRAATGAEVTLTLSVAPPLSAQGIVLTAADGRMAFNNQVKTRIRRSSRRINRLMHDCLFADNREE